MNGVFAAFRHRFGVHRKSGARDLRGLRPLGELKSLRNLQAAPFGENALAATTSKTASVFKCRDEAHPHGIPPAYSLASPLTRTD